MADENVTRPQAEPLHLSPVGWEAELAELRQRQALARELGGKDRVARQHAGGWRLVASSTKAIEKQQMWRSRPLPQTRACSEPSTRLQWRATNLDRGQGS
jgi:hypothetical protein